MITPYNTISQKSIEIVSPTNQQKMRVVESQMQLPKITHSIQYWAAATKFPTKMPLRYEIIVTERIRAATITIRESCDINSEIRGGVPVLKGTRVPIAQIVAELAEDSSVSEIADELELDKNTIVRFLEGLAGYLNRPFFR